MKLNCYSIRYGIHVRSDEFRVHYIVLLVQIVFAIAAQRLYKPRYHRYTYATPPVHSLT